MKLNKGALIGGKPIETVDEFDKKLTEAEFLITDIIDDDISNLDREINDYIDENATPLEISGIEIDEDHTNLQMGVNLVDTHTPSMVTDIEIQGASLQNQLGIIGNFDSTDGWRAWGGTLTCDNNIGTLTGDGSANNPQIIYERLGPVPPNIGDTFIIRATMIATNDLKPRLRLYLYSNATGILAERNIDQPVKDMVYNMVSKVTITQEIVDNWSTMSIRLVSWYSSTANANGSSVRVSKVAFYKVPSDDLQLSETELLYKYPFVNGLQPISNIHMANIRGNLLPPFMDNWDFDASNDFTISKLEAYSLDASSSIPDRRIRTSVKVLPNTKYTIDCGSESFGSFHAIEYKDGIYNGITHHYASPLTGVYEITTSELVDELVIKFGTNEDNLISVKNPLLVQGELKPFSPQKRDEMIIKTQLFSSDDGSVRDTLVYKDGRCLKTSHIKMQKLDGTLDWRFYQDRGGYKIVYVNGVIGRPVNVNTPFYISVEKHITRVQLPRTVSASNGADVFQPGAQSGDTDRIYVTIPDAETGFAESWAGGNINSPNLSRLVTGNEIVKAYFNGWRWTGSGIGWRSMGDSNITSNNVDYVLTNMAPGVKYPYTAYIELETSQTTDISSDIYGTIQLYKGVNNVVCDAGYIHMEKFVPKYSQGHWRINYRDDQDTFLNHEVSRLIHIFKDREDITSKWAKYYNHNNGKNRRAYAHYVTTDNGITLDADYYVNYMAEKFDCSNNIQSIKINKPNNYITSSDNSNKTDSKVKYELDSIKAIV